METVQKQHEQVSNSGHNKSLVVIAENIRTPENVGMIMRLAEAFAVERVYFTGSLGIGLTTKVKRASRNTYSKVTFTFIDDASLVLEEVRAHQYQLLALEITQKSKPIQEQVFKETSRIALVIGSERNGISEALLAEIPDAVHIPLYGENSSINVVTALAIALQEIVRNT